LGLRETERLPWITILFDYFDPSGVPISGATSLLNFKFAILAILGLKSNKVELSVILMSLKYVYDFY